MITLPELTRRIRELPPLPDIAMRLLEASRDPEAQMGELVDLIRHDPALTAKVLRLCNSAYYGLPRKIVSVQEALVYLGTDTLVNFVLAGCLSSFYQHAQHGYGLAAGELWRHSIGCAIAAQAIGPHGDEGADAQAFTAGLLHDIGKLVLDNYVGSAFAEIGLYSKHHGVPFEDAERQILGFSHTDAGAELGKLWNLPEPIVETIACHQNPALASGSQELVARVHLANIMCLSFGIGVGNDGLAYAFHPLALRSLGLELTDLNRLSLDVHEELRRAEEFVGIARAEEAA